MSANWPCVSHKSSSAKIGESEGDEDGGFVRNAEGTLWLETIQGKGIHTVNLVLRSRMKVSEIVQTA